MSLLKPTVKTPFHIDFDWWKQNERDWHVFLRSLLCTEHQKAFADIEEGGMIDWIDPMTAEVKPVDAIQHALMSHCALLPEFSDSRTAVVEAIFRNFLVNGNDPLSAEDLSKRLARPADTILRTIAGPRVYRGLRPYQQSVPVAETSE
ncbi:MAG: hypothetical protein NTW69_15115 [Chloroflexi bacterium]|jgi:hypothetical protein|nr:hypothetical protein [Chloroflexota bacterium]